MSAYLNFPGYFSNVFLAMVKYPGKFNYMVLGGPTKRVLKLSQILFQGILGDGKVSGKVSVAMVKYPGKILFQRILGDGKIW